MATSNKDNVQNWRKRTKERIVKAFGSKCSICSYDRCIEALQFHHLDPAAKESGISKLISHPNGWPAIVEEARKCVMLCANCHTEVHSGLVSVPDNALRFNEEFAVYRKSDFGEQNPCPICNTLKMSNLKTCSHSCSAKMKTYKQFDWTNHDLEQLLLTKSASAIARDLGISNSSVTKRKKVLNLK